MDATRWEATKMSVPVHDCFTHRCGRCADVRRFGPGGTRKAFLHRGPVDVCDCEGCAP